MKIDMRSFSLLTILATLLLSGCQREEPAPPTATQPTVSSETQALKSLSEKRAVVFLAERLSLQRVELPAEALALWRPYAERRPTLLILSNNPMLVPVPGQLQAQVQSFIASASKEELAHRSSLLVVDPLLMPAMTVDAALRAGWFGQVIWAMPQSDSMRVLSVEAYRRVLRENAMLDAQELAGLQVEKQLLRGMVRGIPFLVGPLDQLPKLTGPLIVHIDQSYFQDLYKNEVATPLLSIVYDALYQLRERRLPVLAVTFNYGNLEERIAPEVRFLAEVMAHFVEHLESGQQPAQRNWQRMADIFHLETLFETEKARNLALTMEQDDPTSAWVQFALYRAAVARKAGDYALRYLAEAVKRDRIYAVEYLSLAQMAYDRKRPDASLQMLQLAAMAFPDNPHIRLQMAQLYGEIGDRTAARQLVAQLQKLPWSSVYYPDVAAYLRGFDEYLQTPASATAAAVNPAARTTRGIFPSRHLMGRTPRQPLGLSH